MKTIEIKIGEQIAQFTTKSVTFRGKEFFYSKMTDVAHDADSSTYSFTYEGELIVFPYEKKDLKVLSVIFAQVQNLQPKAVNTKENSSSGELSEKKETQDIDRADAVHQSPQHEENTEKTEAEKPLETIDSTQEQSLATTDKKSAKQAEKERKQAEKARKKAEKEKLKSEKNNDSENAGDEKDNYKSKEKIKKSLIIFAGVIGIVAVMAVAYYFIFGTSSNPSAGPNSTESQQYDDIDELINDLQ